MASPARSATSPGPHLPAPSAVPLRSRVDAWYETESQDRRVCHDMQAHDLKGTMMPCRASSTALGRDLACAARSQARRGALRAPREGSSTWRTRRAETFRVPGDRWSPASCSRRSGCGALEFAASEGWRLSSSSAGRTSTSLAQGLPEGGSAPEAADDPAVIGSPGARLTSRRRRRGAGAGPRGGPRALGPAGAGAPRGGGGRGEPA
jgi:hypothetical protein